MNIYWSLKNVPELADLSPNQRKRVHEDCLRRYFLGAPATRCSVISYLMLILCPTVVVMLAAFVVQAFSSTASFWISVIAATLGAMLGYFIFSRIAITHLRQFYLEYIQKELRP